MKKIILMLVTLIFLTTVSVFAQTTEDTKSRCVTFVDFIKKNNLSTDGYSMGDSNGKLSLAFACQNSKEPACIIRNTSSYGFDFLDMVFLNRKTCFDGACLKKRYELRRMSLKSVSGDSQRIQVSFDATSGILNFSEFRRSTRGPFSSAYITQSDITINASSFLDYKIKSGKEYGSKETEQFKMNCEFLGSGL